MASFGLELLEIMTVSNERGDFNVKKGAVTVSLMVTDPSPWQPTKPNDRKWKDVNKEMIQVRPCFILLFYVNNITWYLT